MKPTCLAQASRLARFFHEGSVYHTFFVFRFIHIPLKMGAKSCLWLKLLAKPEASLEGCREQGAILARCGILWAAVECWDR